MRCNLRDILNQRNITVIHLAEVSGVKRTTIQTYMNGGIPQLDKAYRIAAALNLTVYDIWPLLD
jgi:transcriptional regulator with XRE-family HTH domain